MIMVAVTKLVGVVIATGLVRFMLGILAGLTIAGKDKK